MVLMLRSAALALLVAVAMPTTASCARARAVGDADPHGVPAGRVLAHPIVRGSAGPFRQVTVTLTKPSSPDGPLFTGTLATAGATMRLAGPDEPEDLFLVEPRAVVFTPIDGSRTNGILILYDSSQIGPGHGTDHHVLAYRVERGRAVRQPNIETRLDGVATAAAARAKLARIGSRTGR